MSALGDLLGKGSIAEQLVVWGILNQAIGAAEAPYISQLQQDVNAQHPVNPLSPAELADAVVRNFTTITDATAEAAKNGLNASRFQTLVDMAAEAPAPQQLAEALRREIIAAEGTGAGSTSFQQGIAEGNLAAKWTDTIKSLAMLWPTPVDALAAQLKGAFDAATGKALYIKLGGDPQFYDWLAFANGNGPTPDEAAVMLRRGLIPADGTGQDVTSYHQAFLEGPWRDKWEDAYKAMAVEWPTPTAALDAQLKGAFTGDEGQALYEKLGGDPQFYSWLLFANGSAPTPNEAADMARRGLMPKDGTGQDVVSYEQAFLEGPWRNKWSDVFWASSEFIPSAREVITLLKDQAVDKVTAGQWMARAGADDTTISAFITEADTEALSDYKGLTQSSVLNMYYQRLITADDATTILESLHVSAQAVPLMLSYADLQRAITQQNSAISRIGTLYAARKITSDTARQSLTTLQIPPDAIADIMSTWQLENSINVKLLSEAQIVDAWYLKIMDQGAAETELINIGYTPYDAWVLLSIKAKGPLAGQPAPGPAAPQGAVIPGTT